MMFGWCLKVTYNDFLPPQPLVASSSHLIPLGSVGKDNKEVVKSKKKKKTRARGETGGQRMTPVRVSQSLGPPLGKFHSHLIFYDVALLMLYYILFFFNIIGLHNGHCYFP